MLRMPARTRREDWDDESRKILCLNYGRLAHIILPLYTETCQYLSDVVDIDFKRFCEDSGRAKDNPDKACEYWEKLELAAQKELGRLDAQDVPSVPPP